PLDEAEREFLFTGTPHPEDPQMGQSIVDPGQSMKREFPLERRVGQVATKRHALADRPGNSKRREMIPCDRESLIDFPNSHRFSLCRAGRTVFEPHGQGEKVFFADRSLCISPPNVRSLGSRAVDLSNLDAWTGIAWGVAGAWVAALVVFVRACRKRLVLQA